MTHLRAVPGMDNSGSSEPCPVRSCGGATTVRVEAPGKVNLFLSAGAPGADGYHPLTTVFQAVRLIETVTARSQSHAAHGSITLSLEKNAAGVPADSSNLAVRAARLLADVTGVTDGVDLTIRKRIPVAGGMAGGSADAAATLTACNVLWGTELGPDELRDLAAQLGADVPFPLMGATAVGHGRGDQLTPLMTRGRYLWVLAFAAHGGLSTPTVFRRFDELVETRASLAGAAPAEVPERMTSALRTRDARGLAATLHNDLQEAAVSLRPELAEVMAIAESAGALRAIVSGSGPTVAALVPDARVATHVARALAASGLVRDTARVDGPVAGVRMVG